MTAARALLLFASLAVTSSACGKVPFKTDNRRPRLIALVADRDSLGPRDSVLVTCTAFDPDGDVLVYDWITDARLRIPGRPPNEYHLYDSPRNSQVFYRGPVVPVNDTAWVQCFARDKRGGSDGELIHVFLRD